MGTDARFPVESDKGMIEVRTRPHDAQVTLDDKPVGKNTPARFPAQAGRHELLLQLNGYKPLRKSLTVEKGLLKLSDEDFREHGLYELLREHGPSQRLGRRIFDEMMATISTHPGGNE